MASVSRRPYIPVAIHWYIVSLHKYIVTGDRDRCVEQALAPARRRRWSHLCGYEYSSPCLGFSVLTVSTVVRGCVLELSLQLCTADIKVVLLKICIPSNVGRYAMNHHIILDWRMSCWSSHLCAVHKWDALYHIWNQYTGDMSAQVESLQLKLLKDQYSHSVAYFYHSAVPSSSSPETWNSLLGGILLFWASVMKGCKRYLRKN